MILIIIFVDETPTLTQTAAFRDEFGGLQPNEGKGFAEIRYRSAIGPHHHWDYPSQSQKSDDQSTEKKFVLIKFYLRHRLLPGAGIYAGPRRFVKIDNHLPNLLLG